MDRPAAGARRRGGPFLLKTEMAAGHGGRSGRYDAWHEEALVLAWIVATAGAPPGPGANAVGVPVRRRTGLPR